MYFVLFHTLHILPQGKGRQPLGQLFWWKQKGLITLITDCMFQKISLPSDFMHIFFMILYMYIAPAEEDNPLGPKFWCQLKGLVTLAICCTFQKQPIGAKIFMSIDWTDSSLWPFVASFKKSLQPIFSWFYKCTAVGQGQTTLRGQNFDVKRNLLSLQSFATSFKRISLKSDFIYIFFIILYVYIPWGRGRQPPGCTILLSTDTFCHFCHLLQVSKNLFKVWFRTHFLMILYIYIAPGRGRQPLGEKILLSTERPYHFAHLLQVSKKSFWILIL